LIPFRLLTTPFLTVVPALPIGSWALLLPALLLLALFLDFMACLLSAAAVNHKTKKSRTSRFGLFGSSAISR
jgi:hypothetical protein